MSEHNHSIELATRKPLDERALAIVGRNIIETSESIAMANPGASLESKFVIALGAPKISCQTSIDIAIIQNLMNPKHTRRPIRVINGDIKTVARELLQNNAEADSKAAVLNWAGDGRHGGGWLEWGEFQEGALCYSSTL
jgi:hypothetical protein